MYYIFTCATSFQIICIFKKNRQIKHKRLKAYSHLCLVCFQIFVRIFSLLTPFDKQNTLQADNENTNLYRLIALYQKQKFNDYEIFVLVSAITKFVQYISNFFDFTTNVISTVYLTLRPGSNLWRSSFIEIAHYFL